MVSNPVVLILGSGPRVGASVAKKFASLKYSVAIVSRKGSNAIDDEGYLSLKADFGDPDSIPAVFKKVEAEFKVAPSVVIYNAAVLSPPPVQDDIFSTSTDTLIGDLKLNTISPFVAAQQAVRGWKTLPDDTKKSFIYTGNILNVKQVPAPAMLTLGIGKSASSSWVSLADVLYSKSGYRFFYADERKEDGSLKGSNIDGDAHADFYADLAKQDENYPWLATFVKDKGYVKFE